MRFPGNFEKALVISQVPGKPSDTSGTCPTTVFCLFSYLDLCALLGSRSPHFLLLQDTCDLVGVSKQGGTYTEGFGYNSDVQAKFAISEQFKMDDNHPSIWCWYIVGGIANHPEIGGYKIVCSTSSLGSGASALCSLC